MKRIILTLLVLILMSAFPVIAQIDFEGNTYAKTNSFETYILNYTISQDLDSDGEVRLVLGYIWENKTIINIRDGHWKDFQINNPLNGTGVYAKNHTKDQIWNALKNRRTYGTTGGRLLGFFSINKHFVGSEFSTNKRPTLNIALRGTDEFSEVFIYRNGEELVY